MKIIVRKGPPNKAQDDRCPTVMELWMDEEEACHEDFSDATCEAMLGALKEHLQSGSRWRVQKKWRTTAP